MKTITREEFRADPHAALLRTMEEGPLTVLNKDGKPCLTISGQNEALGCEYDGVVHEYDGHFVLDIGGSDIEDDIDADDLFADFVGKRVRVSVEVIE